MYNLNVMLNAVTAFPTFFRSTFVIYWLSSLIYRAFSLLLLWPLARLTNGKVPQNLASPPRTALIIDILTMYGSRVIHRRVFPERSSEPWHKVPSKRVPVLVCPAAHSSAYCAFRFYPSTSAWLLGKKHTVPTFTRQSVWCLGDRWQEDSGVLVQKEPRLVLVVPAQFAHGDTVTDWTTWIHGFLGQLSPIVVSSRSLSSC